MVQKVPKDQMVLGNQADLVNPVDLYHLQDLQDLVGPMDRYYLEYLVVQLLRGSPCLLLAPAAPLVLVNPVSLDLLVDLVAPCLQMDQLDQENLMVQMCLVFLCHQLYL